MVSVARVFPAIFGLLPHLLKTTFMCKRVHLVKGIVLAAEVVGDVCDHKLDTDPQNENPEHIKGFDHPVSRR